MTTVILNRAAGARRHDNTPLERGSLRVALDGEVVVMTAPLNFRVRPLVPRVIVR